MPRYFLVSGRNNSYRAAAPLLSFRFRDTWLSPVVNIGYWPARIDFRASLELKDRAPLTVRAGEAIVEPPNVAMIGHNPSATEPTNGVIFYVSTPDTPFLDSLHH